MVIVLLLPSLTCSQTAKHRIPAKKIRSIFPLQTCKEVSFLTYHEISNSTSSSLRKPSLNNFNCFVSANSFHSGTIPNVSSFKTSRQLQLPSLLFFNTPYDIYTFVNRQASGFSSNFTMEMVWFLLNSGLNSFFDLSSSFFCEKGVNRGLNYV